MRIFLQSPSPGEEFQPIATPKDSEEPVIVFESVFQKDIDKLIESKGFSRLILAEGAKAAPYNPGTSFEEIGERDARNEVENARKQLDAAFELDHVVFCTVKEIGEPLCKSS